MEFECEEVHQSGTYSNIFTWWLVSTSQTLSYKKRQAPVLTQSSGFIGAIIRFIQFNTTKLDPDIALHDVRPVIWGIIEPAMYQIAATLPLLRPVLKVMLGWTGIPRALRSQRLEDPEANQGEKPHALRLDDYHYMQDPRGAKGHGKGVGYTGVLRVTDISVSSDHDGDMEVRRGGC